MSSAAYFAARQTAKSSSPSMLRISAPCPAKETVQLYYSAPQGVLGKPAKELAAFAKTHLLNPGESETLALSFDIADIASFDDLGKVKESPLCA